MKRAANPARAGFTLVELLMVVVISLLAATMAIPLFAQSSRSTRLRAAARTIIAAHRYARGMAVLRQADLALMLDEGIQRVQVIRLDGGPAANPETEEEAIASPAPATTAPAASMEARFFLSAERPAALPPEVVPELDRQLPDGVRIARIDGHPMQRHEYTSWINYHANGMCDPFTVELQDDRGGSLTVRIDGATGRAEVIE